MRSPGGELCAMIGNTLCWYQVLYYYASDLLITIMLYKDTAYVELLISLLVSILFFGNKGTNYGI
jgi:hypothetical protein